MGLKKVKEANRYKLKEEYKNDDKGKVNKGGMFSVAEAQVRLRLG